MKLVVCHYHLNRGGVTRVIENQLQSLATLDAIHRPSSVIVAFGGRSSDWNSELADQLPFDLELVTVPGLDYDSLSSGVDRDLAADLLEMFTAHGCDNLSTILHFHNHSLGKNSSVPKAIVSLANDGWRTLLQLHDFSEDLRPQNYKHLVEAFGSIDALHARLYPQAEHIHYATINRRDFDMLAAAGVASDQLHLIPNPVVSIQDSKERRDASELRDAARQKLAESYGVDTKQTYVLYPVRGIQRKNLGELLLWASLCDDVTFAITLPPMNPREREFYESWKTEAEMLSLSVLFEVGEKLSLAENYAAADAIITTSVAEGFGLVFLEAALMNRRLIGRNLPGITDDFSAAGIRFPDLVDSIKIPLSCVDVKNLKQNLVEQTTNLRVAYDVAAADECELVTAVESLFDSEVFDFGRLDSRAQKHVLHCVQQQSDLRQKIRELNPVLTRVGKFDVGSVECEVVAANRESIEQHYSLNSIGRRLNSIYEALVDGKPSGVESRPSIASKLQQEFLRPDQMYPLRLE